MLSPRIKRRATRSTRALKSLATVEAEIVGLPDEDLLDLVDNFTSRTSSIIGKLATVEMNKRGLTF
jgi:hypothetical protein